MYGSLFHRYDHASKGSEVARSTLKESRGLAEILFRINGKEKGIGAVIGRTVSLFRNKVEQAIDLVTLPKAPLKNVEWNGTGGILTSIANLVNNLNSKDNSQILISKEVDRFIKGFAFSIPFIVSSNYAYGSSSFGANHTSLMGHEYSTLNAKQEQALKMVRGGNHIIMSGFQEFAILDNTTGIVILASEVGNTPKEGEKFLRDIIDGKSVSNAENIGEGNKGKIINANFLTNNLKSDNIRVNVKFNPLNNNMGTQQKGEFSQRKDKAPEVVRETSFDKKAASAMAQTNAKAMRVLDGNSPDSRKEAVFDKYSQNREEVKKIIQSGNYFISGGTFSEPELRDSLGTKIKFSEFASSVEEGMNLINEIERTLSKTISEAPTGIATGGKEGEVDPKTKVAKGKGFSHSLNGGGANGKIVLEDNPNFHFDISGGVVGFQNLKDFYISLGAQLAKVVDLGDGQKGGLTMSIDTKNLGQKELKILGILTSDIGKDGRANLGIGYGSSNIEKYGKSIDLNTYSIGAGYEHFVVSNIINAIQGAVIYSSTGDVLGINTTQLVERSANFYRVSEVITNLRGANRTKGTAGVKFNLGDPHDKLSLDLGIDHKSYGGTLSSTTEPLVQASYSHIWGEGDNHRFYLSGELTGSFQKGTAGYDYRKGPVSVGPESSIIHREGEKAEGQGLLTFKYLFNAGTNDSGHPVIDESKGRPELTTDYLLNNNGFYTQMKSSLDPQYKEEKVKKRIFEASNLPAGYEINGETLSFDTGVNNLTGAVDGVMPNNGMAGHFSVNGNKLVISNISTLTPGPTYKVSLTKADGTFVVIEIPTHEGSVIFDNFRIASNVSAANKTAYMNGTKTFDQIEAADTTAPTTPTVIITDSDSSTGTAESGYTNQANVNISKSSNDSVGVTGWYVVERATTDPVTSKPSASAGGWSSTNPGTHTLSATGSRTIDVFTKDAEGNVSERGSDTIIYDNTNDITNKSLTAVNTNAAINETINFEEPVKIISVSGTSILNISTTGSFISSLQVTGTAGGTSGLQTKTIEVQDRAGTKKSITVSINVTAPI